MIVFDPKLMRPACVLLQVPYGGNRDLTMRFPPESWLTGPTPDLAVYEVTSEEADKLVAYVKARLESGKRGKQDEPVEISQQRQQEDL